MRTRQGSVLEALRRTKDFLDANPELLAAVNKSSTRRNLDAIAAQLTAHGVTQDGSARATTGETARQGALRAALRFNHMRPVAVVAKRKLQGVPEFHSLRMPKGNLTIEPLVMAARGMAEAARSHTEVLIENGLPDDFIEQLLAAATLLEKSIDERNALRRSRAGSTAGLTAEEGRGRAILRVLDSVVRPKLGDNATLLAQWKTTKQVRRARSVVAATTTPPTVVVAPTPPTVIAPPTPPTGIVPPVPSVQPLLTELPAAPLTSEKAA